MSFLTSTNLEQAEAVFSALTADNQSSGSKNESFSIFVALIRAFLEVFFGVNRLSVSDANLYNQNLDNRHQYNSIHTIIDC